MKDVLAVLLSSTALAAAGTTNGTGFNLPYGTPRRGLWANFRFSGVTNGSYAVKIQDSPDNSTWSDLSTGNQAITANTEEVVAFNTDKPYVRAVVVATGATVVATVECYIQNSKR